MQITLVLWIGNSRWSEGKREGSWALLRFKVLSVPAFPVCVWAYVRAREREIKFANHILNYIPLSAVVEPSIVQDHSLQSLTSTFFTMYASV